MGMLKTAISRRILHVVEDEHDGGAEKPETPKHNKSRFGKIPTQIGAAPAPAVFMKREKSELKEGHNPNKPAGMISQRHIIVQPSMRHMNYQPSTRNINVNQPHQKIMGTMNGLDQKTMRNMNGMNKKSSMRNINAFTQKSTRQINNFDAKNTIAMGGMGSLGSMSSINEDNTHERNFGIKGTLPKRGMVSNDPKNMRNNMNPFTQKSMRQISNFDTKNSKTLGGMGSIDEDNTSGDMKSTLPKRGIGMGMVSNDPKNMRNNMSPFTQKSTRQISNFDTKNSKSLGGMGSIDEDNTSGDIKSTLPKRGMGTVNNDPKNMRNNMSPFTQKSTRQINNVDTKNSKSLGGMGSIDEDNTSEDITSALPKRVMGLGSINEDNTRGITFDIMSTMPMRGMESIAENKTRNVNDYPEHNTMPMLGMVSIAEDNTRSIDTIDEEGNVDSIDEKSFRIIDTIDENNAGNTGNKNTFSTNNKSPESKSFKSSATSIKSSGTSSTKSSASTSTKSTRSIDTKSSNGTDNKSNSNHSSTMNDKSNHSTSMNSKSNHSVNTRNSDKTRNTDNMSPDGRDRTNKSQQRIRTRKGTTAGVPVVNNTRDRPSTALITRKELEEILAAKRKEELLEKKTMPPRSGTISTDLWIAQTNNGDSSQCSGTDYEISEEFKKEADPEDEYDINFFDYTEEEETLHTSSGHMDLPLDSHTDSFDADELNLANSIERRFTTIRFDEYDELQTCLHINDYTKGEISRSWYKREDYDKMVDLARKTAQKAVKREKELQEELKGMLSARDSLSPPRSGRRKGKTTNKSEDPTFSDGNASGDNKSVGNSGRSRRSVGTADGKRKKPIEYRGLEAWTPEGSAKCRSLKETAIENVWNEQSRQWEEGEFDAEAISDVYMPVAKTALDGARERANADEKMVKKLIDQERAREEKKSARTGFTKSKEKLRNKARSTGKTLVQGTGKVFSGTGKVGLKIGKRGAKAVVAAATADPKMMNEALKIRIQKKKRECKHEMILTTSRAAHERDVEELEESGSLSIGDSSGLLFSPSNGRPGLQRPGLVRTGASSHDHSDKASVYSDDMSSATGGESQLSTGTTPSKKKKSKMKLLGVVPIPGTQKKYSQDRREERNEKRRADMIRRPSWEASMTTGKY